MDDSAPVEILHASNDLSDDGADIAFGKLGDAMEHREKIAASRELHECITIQVSGIDMFGRAS